jgi:hypothetical protein
MNFDNVWSILNNSVPPEITHYQHGSHPGKTWWLKTVVPNSDTKVNVFKVWKAIEKSHKKLVRLVPQAYDWHQTCIPHAHSVWVNHKVDVSLVQAENGFTYQISDYDKSFNEWGEHLQLWLSSQAVPQSKENDPHDWHKLWHVTELVKTWTTDAQAKHNRGKIKIVKTDSSEGPAHHRPNMDSN